MLYILRLLAVLAQVALEQFRLEWIANTAGTAGIGCTVATAGTVGAALSPGALLAFLAEVSLD